MRVLVVAIALLVAGCTGGEARVKPGPDAGLDAGPPAVRIDPLLLDTRRVVTDAASRRPLNGDLRIPAEVVASESASAEVGALVAGRLGSIEVREGDRVRRGQLLATVDSPEAARAVADRIRARARAVGAARKLARQLALELDRATSPAAVDEARTEVIVADADAAASRSLLASLGIPEPAEQASGATRVPIRSPIDGVVVARLVALGAPILAETTLFRVVATDRVVVEARWTEDAIAAPTTGMAARFLPRGRDAGAGCSGHVLATIALVEEKTRTRRVRIAPDEPCSDLVVGGYVDVSLTSATLAGPNARALALPRSAVVDIRGATTVFVAGREKGTFHPRLVRTGRVTSDDIAIDEGIEEGDRVVVSGAILLKGELLKAELEAP